MATPLAHSFSSAASWFQEAADRAEQSIASIVRSQGLEDAIRIVDAAGIVLAIFKFAKWIIPEPTAEERLAQSLCRSLIQAVDQEFEVHQMTARESSKRGRKRELMVTAKQRMETRTVYLTSLLGKSADRSVRSWPIIADLADVGREWLTGILTSDGSITAKTKPLVDESRGRIFDELVDKVSLQLQDPALREAIELARSRESRQALLALAAEASQLEFFRIFGEIAQNTIYINPSLKVFDYRDGALFSSWHDLQVRRDGQDALIKKIVEEHPRIVVIEGDMGSGKSCLLRTLAASLGTKYLTDRKLAPIYLRWRDLHAKSDLIRGIAAQIAEEYGLSIGDLKTQGNIAFLIDGFDEMGSHQEEHVLSKFDQLSELCTGDCSLIVTMRSALVTPNLRVIWSQKRVLACEVQVFDIETIDKWADLWRKETGADWISGTKLRELCSFGGRQNIAQNPLLLYMLARYFDRAEGGKPLSRAEVFRLFVDETLRGKSRYSREEFPFAVSEHYRLLLQEIAYISSWPSNAPNCPVRQVRKCFGPVMQDINFRDLRTAFVLYFFEPSVPAEENFFEFQPEGFRQYLFAEWCVRAQIEIISNGTIAIDHSFARQHDDAMTALAQFSLKKQERELLYEIYEELGALARIDGEEISSRLKSFGIGTGDSQTHKDLVRKLLREMKKRCIEVTSSPLWMDQEKLYTGVPRGEEVPDSLANLRFIVNYLEHCLVCVLGLSRGLNEMDQDVTVFGQSNEPLGRFLRMWSVVRGFSAEPEMDLSRVAIPEIDLSYSSLRGVTFNRIRSTKANFSRSTLGHTDFEEAVLEGSSFVGTDLSYSYWTRAIIGGTDFSYSYGKRVSFAHAQLGGGIFVSATFDEADFSDAQLMNAKLMNLRFTDGIFLRVICGQGDLTGAVFFNTNCRHARLDQATLVGAAFNRCQLNQARLVGVRANGVSFLESDLSRANCFQASLVAASFRASNCSLVDFSEADLREADLRGTDFSGSKMVGAKLEGAILDAKTKITAEQLATLESTPTVVSR